MSDGQTRIMIKAGALSASFRMGAGRAAPQATVRPLFDSIERDTALGAAETPRWQMLETDQDTSAWDLCHGLLTEGLGFDGAPSVQFAEPDLVQRWVAEPPQQTVRRLAAGCAAPEPQDPRFPQVAQGQNAWPDWHQHPNYSQFGAIPNRDRRLDVRVAHVDTGYDPAHSTLPKFLEPHLARSFVGGDLANSAIDRSSGLIQNAGHGTGTLSILAGAGMGCAPGVSVVPIRVADAVVLLRSSAIAQAFDYIHQLCRDPSTFVHVVTMSMGGLASQAWAEAVNALYEAGVTLVTAAGNNFGNLPTRLIVYPARFNRVTAAAGVMADFRPYADLGLNRMAGNYGPGQKMGTTIAACTPNVPWARMGCQSVVDSNGAGTSAATPQVAAAAALWIAKNRAAWDAYDHGWQKVEAVRRALFDSAALTEPNGTMGDAGRIGRGRLQAAAALATAPRKAAQLVRTAPDSASFAPLRLLTGLGLHEGDETRLRMLELEALQLSQSAEIEALLPEGPDVPPEDPARLRQLGEALGDQPGASRALRDALAGVAGRSVHPSAAASAAFASSIPGEEELRRRQLAHATSPALPPPRSRRLKVFAFDPAMSARLDTLALNEVTLEVPWEPLQPGPVGRYLEVIDIDPASNCAYSPVDLEAPEILARDGLSPSEADPRFHQQMVYAVAMRTIDAFESALGRVSLWSPREVRDSAGRSTETFVPRLRVHPHALRAANAYYSPDRKALLFGYFRSGPDGQEHLPPGGLVFTSLSHDVIAHETTHALLDGLHRRFRIPTNPDVLAFHEAFADIVALFQHFSIPEALQSEIARTRGDLGQQGVLGALAQQFGAALGGHGALRDFLGGYEEQDGERVWKARKPSRRDYPDARGPHARGAVLVAAVFDAFLQIYRRRGSDLIRLATGGTGVLPEGEIPHDLVSRLTQEAALAASHVLRICIRALDYCPPIDITFGEYLRALITADADMVPDDPLAYRTAFVSAFRCRGIPIEGIAHVSPTSLMWEPPGIQADGLSQVLGRMSLDWKRSAERETAYACTEENVRKFQRWMRSEGNVSDAVLAALGLRRDAGPLPLTITDRNGNPSQVPGTLHAFIVNSVRPARRVTEGGEVLADLVVDVTQRWTPEARPDQGYDGGCTLLIDIERAEIRYCIRKRVANERRVAEQLAFVAEQSDAPLAATYTDVAPRRGEPFAMLHSAPMDWG